MALLTQVLVVGQHLPAVFAFTLLAMSWVLLNNLETMAEHDFHRFVLICAVFYIWVLALCVRPLQYFFKKTLYLFLLFVFFHFSNTDTARLFLGWQEQYQLLEAVLLLRSQLHAIIEIFEDTRSVPKINNLLNGAKLSSIVIDSRYVAANVVFRRQEAQLEGQRQFRGEARRRCLFWVHCLARC